MSDGLVDGLPPHLQSIWLGAQQDSLPSQSADVFANVIRANHRARDVTSSFQQAAKGLRAGQLVKNDTFTLFEAVQALEIMDPKMDSGLLGPNESLVDEVDLNRALLAEEVLGIIEQMLCYEMAWHQGYPLSQTLLTSLHLGHLLAQERPTGALPTFSKHDEDGSAGNPLLHLVLRAYCIGVIKSCDIAIEMVGSQMFFEEEDFNLHTYGYDFLTDVPDEEALQLLVTANAWLLEHRHEDSTGVVFQGIRDHLVARKDLVDAFLPVPDKPLPKILFRSCKRRLEGIKKAHPKARPVRDCFSSKVHRKLASTAPPRNPVELSFDEAITSLETLYDDLLRALDIVNFDGGTDGLKNFLWSYSMRKHQPSGFPRAFLQSLTVGEGAPAGADRIGELIWYDLEVSAPAIDMSLDRGLWEIELPKDIRFKVARIIDFFIERAGPEYVRLIQSLCQNQCRIRRCLANILGDFDKLLDDFEAAGEQLALDDMDAARHPLMISARRTISRCLRMQMVQIMQWIMHLGLDQELFLHHELLLGHWTLRHFAKENSDNLLGMLTKGAQKSPESTLRLLRLEAKVAVEQVQLNIADGLTVIYQICHYLGLLPSLQAVGLSTPALQYELRMQPFMGLRSYRLPEFETYEASVRDSSQSIESLVENAASSIEDARKGISELKRGFDPRLVGKTRCEVEWDDNMQCTDKVCVRAKLSLHTLRQQIALHGAGKVKEYLAVTVPHRKEWDSPWWVLPSIVAKSTS